MDISVAIHQCENYSHTLVNTAKHEVSQFIWCGETKVSRVTVERSSYVLPSTIHCSNQLVKHSKWHIEFLKANGIEDSSFVKEMDYQEVLNSQEIFGNELEMFAKKEKQKEVIVPKQKGEILGMVVVESGWGSMLPTVVIANMAQCGPAARCGQLNIGDQIIAINGVSLVGLPLSACQNYIKVYSPPHLVVGVSGFVYGTS
ncbi:protein lin-10-like [Tachypleus tridentatus]|uniref:protein lin-10-like n=1 Tax=Tachypleus tridentatus TaxID=6853 RepID=UPI003FD324E3